MSTLKLSQQRKRIGQLKGKVPVCLLLLLLTFGLLQSVWASPNAVMQNDSGWLDSAGQYHVTGEVKNTGGVWLIFVRVTATLKDQNGATIDMPFAYPWLFRLPPGVLAGFDIVELDKAKSSQVHSYSLNVDWQLGQPLSVKLQITNVASSKNFLGWLQLTGQVQNAGDTISENTLVAGTFYGSDGKVVYVTTAATNSSTIPPSGKAPFTLTIIGQDRSNLVASWSLTAESSQYASVAEFPWQSTLTLLAAVLLTLTVVKTGARKNRRQRDTLSYGTAWS
jgi:hypothetical protein